MRSLDKDKPTQIATAYGQRTGAFIVNPNQSSILKSQLDQILNQDYNDWKIHRQRFNAINSQTAQNRQLITQYLHGVYRDYRIPDPLLSKSTLLHGSYSSKKKHFTPPQIAKIKKPNGENLPSQLISTHEPYATPTKHHKKGLELVNPKSPVSILRQKRQYQYFTPEKIQPFQESKMKIVQRTAPSLHSSFLLGNSMNQGFSQTEMNKNLIGNDYYDNSLYQSRLSLAARLADRSNDKSRKTIIGDIKPSFTDLNQPSLFSTPQKTYSYLTDKDRVQVTFGSEEPLEKKQPYRQITGLSEKNHSLREYQLRKYENKLYAQRIFQNSHQFDKFSFNPSNKSIKQFFRYCIGCEKPILEANINFHQNQCLQFKKILNLTTIQEITQQIDIKIYKILKQINEKSEEVHENDPQNIVSSSRVLISEIEDFKKIKQNQALNPLSSQSFNSEYDKVMSIGKNWGLLTEEVNKLRWFLVVKNNFIKIQIQKSS